MLCSGRNQPNADEPGSDPACPSGKGAAESRWPEHHHHADGWSGVDGTNQLCYGRNGLSLQLTGTYFGRYAQQTAQQNFGSRLPLRRFELSNGVFCQSDRQSCWRMENGQRVTAGRITNQLFGNAPAPFPNPTPYPNPTRNPVPDR